MADPSSPIGDALQPEGVAAAPLPLVSIVIPHYNDLDNLARCLDRLRRQSWPASRREIIIADNNSEGGTAAVEAIAPDARVVPAREQGAGPARNAAAAAARGSILAFIDSDCFAAETWLAEGVAALQGFDYVGGEVRICVPDPRRPTPAEAYEIVFAFDFKKYIERDRFSGTGNLFVPKPVFERVGGFRSGVSEDIDWCRRANALGYRLGHAEKAVVEHPARREWGALTRRWERVVTEMFLLRREERHWLRGWLAYAALVALSPLPHALRVVRHRQLSGVRNRILGLVALFGLREYRAFRMLGCLWRFRAGGVAPGQDLRMSELPAADTRRARLPIAILGVPIDNVTAAEAVAAIDRMVASRRPHYFVTANVDFLVQAREDAELRRILLEADLVLCDGAPILWASRLLGNPLPERVAGSDLVPLLLELARQKGYRVFFLGASPEAAAQALVNVGRRHPGLLVAGHSPPFGAFQASDDDAIDRRLAEVRPDLLFVAFGCPKQEKWIAARYRRLGVPVSGGVGATVDFLSGRRRRAPPWMQRAGLEWAFRLLGEPRRLFGRYWKDFRVFGSELLRQYRLLRPRADGDPIAPSTTVEDGEQWRSLKLPRHLDRRTLESDPLLARDKVTAGRHCLLDLSGTKFIDSTGVGFLLAVDKRLRSTGRQLVLVSPGREVRRALVLMRLDDHFAVAADAAAARRMLECRAAEAANLASV